MTDDVDVVDMEQENDDTFRRLVGHDEGVEISGQRPSV